MSRDTTPFVAPVRYPSPPRDMWYKVPEEPPRPTERPPPIFPWEVNQPPPTRVFGEPPPPPTADAGFGSPPPRISGEPAGPTSPVSESEHSVGFGEKEIIEVSLDEPPTAAPSSVKHYGEHETPEIHESALTPPPKDEEPKFQASNFWASPSATNAWDEIPGIRRYIERVIDQTGLGGPRRYSDAAHTAEKQQRQAAIATNRHQGFFKVTDFPSADDRPSLPVTPAPVRTGDNGKEAEPVGFPLPLTGDEEDAGASDDKGDKGVQPRLAEAEGVPPQSDWVCVHGRRWGPADCLCDLANVLRLHKNPVEQLEKLASLHNADTHSVLRRLSADDPNVRHREVPARSLPPSSEGVLQSNYQQQQRRHSHQDHSHFSRTPRKEDRKTSWSQGFSSSYSRTGEGTVVDTAGIPQGAPLLAPVPIKAGLPASKVTTARLIPVLLEHEEEEGGEQEEEEQSYNVNGKTSAGYALSSGKKHKGKERMAEPSYSGPGAAWEPGVYLPRNVTGALPSEEERDVLDT
ncbi:hypothetical protein jhhlp_001829 [Lomentospora prolificans]|uniref:Uncharacterized protein n=1 Tax=Lomentospora prolificans TaxID=41688 RepID=A0A2N3NGX6_9PEZI|nr:hypothetical protein jhhlp_001829 [Lomentospora prolificans]